MAVPRVDARTGWDGSDEATLVQKLAAYEAEAWRFTFERYFPPIFRLAVRRTIQANTAEDIAAEVFAEAARGIERYRYRGVPFRAWLFRIANNVIADHLKARGKRSGYGSIDTVQETLPAVAEDIEMRTDFAQALDHLTAEQRTVIVLRVVEGCSLAEVANVLGKSTGAVKQLQRRALAVLRERMSLRGAA